MTDQRSLFENPVESVEAGTHENPVPDPEPVRTLRVPGVLSIAERTGFDPTRRPSDAAVDQGWVVDSGESDAVSDVDDAPSAQMPEDLRQRAARATELPNSAKNATPIYVKNRNRVLGRD